MQKQGIVTDTVHQKRSRTVKSTSIDTVDAYTTPFWLIDQWSGSAAHNRRVIDDIYNQISVAKNKLGRQVAEAKLRLTLLLLTGGGSDAELFVYRASGKLKNIIQINVAVKDLLNAYRIDNSPLSAWWKKEYTQFRRWNNFLYHCSLTLLSIFTIFVIYYGTHKFTQHINSKLLKKITKTKTKSFGIATGLLLTPETLHIIRSRNNTRHDKKSNKAWYALNPFRNMFTHGSLTLGQLQSAKVLQSIREDGITPHQLKQLKHVANILMSIDNDIKMLKRQYSNESTKVLSRHLLHTKISQYEQTHETHSLIHYFGIRKNAHKDMALLFHNVVDHPEDYTRSVLIHEMFEVSGKDYVYGYHFIDSKGRRRETVEDILLAYLIGDERAMQSIDMMMQKLLPKIASSTTVKHAKNKQNTIRKSKHKYNSPRYKIEYLINKYPAVVFSATYCPYCSKVKASMHDAIRNKKCKVVELDLLRNGEEYKKELFKMTKQSTIPNVFINGKHIGGSEDTEQWLLLHDSVK